MSVFIKDTDLYFSCDAFVWFCYLSSIDLIERNGKYSLPVLFFLKSCKG